MYPALIKKVDEKLRQGSVGEAAVLLHKVEVNELLREERLPLAALCRRANLIQLGLRLLTPIVCDRLGGDKATVEEWAEYAVLLQRSGGVREATNILSRPELKKFGPTPLYLSYCLFNTWNYLEAIPHLESYVRQEMPAYDRLIGATNLVAALIFGGYPLEASELAAKNIELARTGGFARLRSNNLELLAHAHFESGRFTEARNDLDEAVGIVGGGATNDQLFIHKWRAALEANQSRSLNPLLKFRAAALNQRNFESVREADLLCLRLYFSEDGFNKLYFGSPYRGYRDRIERILGRSPDEKQYVMGKPAAEISLEMRTGVLQGLNVEFPAGSQVHQVLEILTRDAYKPLRIGAIFSELFRGEYFYYDSSPTRVHQALRRTRRWLEETQFPLRLQAVGNQYYLRQDENLKIIIEREAELPEWEAVQISRLQRRFAAGQELGAKEIRHALGLSPANFKRLSGYAVQSGALARKGIRAGTTYTVKEKKAG